MFSFFFSFGFDADRNWNINLPGFGSDEIKTYRKPVRISIDLFLLSTMLFGTELHNLFSVIFFTDKNMNNVFVLCSS